VLSPVGSLIDLFIRGLNKNREHDAPGGSEVNPADQWHSRRIPDTSVMVEAPRWLLLFAGCEKSSSLRFGWGLQTH
jgi:hypothetical protein